MRDAVRGLDIARFALPNTPTGEVRFEEPRDIREIVVTFRGTPPLGLDVHYLQKTWPHSRWELGRDQENPFRFGWFGRDDQFNSTWRKAAIRIRRHGATLVATFAGLSREFGDAADYDVTFRRTLGIRIVTPRPDRIGRVDVRTVSAPARTVLRVELHPQRGTPRRVVRVSGYNAVPVRRGSGRRFAVAVDHLAPAHPYSGDEGLVTLEFPDDAVTVSLASLATQGPVWSKDFGVFVARADDPVTLDGYRRRHEGDRTVLDRVRAWPEHGFGASFHGQPRPHAVNASLGWKHARQKFWVEPNGDVVLHRENVTRLPGRDTAAFKNRGTARFFFGLEDAVPLARFADAAPVPVATLRVRRGCLRIEQEVLCVPLHGRSHEGAPDDPQAALVRFRFVNEGDVPVRAELPIGYSGDSERSYNAFDRGEHQDDRRIPRSNREPLNFRKRGLWSSFEGKPVLRAAVATEMAVSRRGEDLVLSRLLRPGAACEAVFKIPYVALSSPQELRRLRALSFDPARRLVARFWRAENGRGAQLRTPEPAFDAVHAAHLTHVEIADMGMVGHPGLVNTSVGSSTYGNYSNESCMIVQELDQRGLHDEARRRLAVWLRYQGTAPQPGNFTDFRGMFFGAGGFEHGAYNQHHGWVLWCLAEHWFLTRDAAWLRGAAGAIIAGADWIFRQRRETTGVLPHSRGWERGFLPAGSLEDVTDFHYWLSTNALTWRGADHAARALAAIGHPEAARIKAEADAYRADLIAGFETMRRAAPLVRLGDGRWVPHYPSRLYVRGRDFGWIREVLEGAVYLLLSGLYAPGSREAGWILDDYQDNLYHTPPFGYPLTDPIRTLRARGGFSMQPNLLAGLLPHLDRDEPGIYLWMLFNGFASCYREEINGLIEHPAPELGFSNATGIKTSDEANAVMWIRYALVTWNHAGLHLGRAMPRAWLADGRVTALTGVATYFGPVDVRWVSAVAAGRITLTVTLHPPADAPRVTVRFRHPADRPIRSVRVNGRPWKRFKARTGDVDLSGLRGHLAVMAEY